MEEQMIVLSVGGASVAIPATDKTLAAVALIQRQALPLEYSPALGRYARSRPRTQAEDDASNRPPRRAVEIEIVPGIPLAPLREMPDDE